jgi:LmbE family N-acetylglucosaminyl deacetylase
MPHDYSIPRSTSLREEILGAERVLCIQPHYDDNDIAAGGTFALLAGRGVEVHYLTVTDNLAGVTDAEISDEQAAAILADEQRRSGAEIGVHAQHELGLPDAGAWDEVELRRSFIEHIRVIQPDYVFTCDPWLPHEAHRDHLRTGILAAEAVMFHGMPRFRTRPEVDEAWTPHELRGLVLYYTLDENVVFDVTVTHERKHRAMACYQAQISGQALDDLHRGISFVEKQRGEREGFERAEAFKLLRPGQLHCGIARLG